MSVANRENSHGMLVHYVLHATEQIYSPDI